MFFEDGSSGYGCKYIPVEMVRRPMDEVGGDEGPGCIYECISLVSKGLGESWDVLEDEHDKAESDGDGIGFEDVYKVLE